MSPPHTYPLPTRSPSTVPRVERDKPPVVLLLHRYPTPGLTVSRRGFPPTTVKTTNNDTMDAPSYRPPVSLLYDPSLSPLAHTFFPRFEFVCVFVRMCTCVYLYAYVYVTEGRLKTGGARGSLGRSDCPHCPSSTTLVSVVTDRSSTVLVDPCSGMPTGPPLVRSC